MKLDTALTHPNETIAHAAAAYCIAIKHLIKNHNKLDRAQAAFMAAEGSTTDKDVQDWFVAAKQLLESKAVHEGRFLSLDDYNPQQRMSYVKHAFILSFYSLLRAESMEEDQVCDHVMRQCAILAGDTDTNCAIAGGLVGAYVGAYNLPRSKVKKVLECDTSLGREADRLALFQP